MTALVIFDQLDMPGMSPKPHPGWLWSDGEQVHLEDNR